MPVKNKNLISLIFGLTALIIIIICIGVYFTYQNHQISAVNVTETYQTPEESNDIYVRFDMEAYDSITENYWAATSTYDLPQLFQASLAKVTSTSPILSSHDRIGTAKILASIIEATSSVDAKRQLAVAVLEVALYNLQPAGRSSLASQQQVTALRNEVSNVNPSTDLYGDLGVSSSSSATEIKQAYIEQSTTLAHATSSADKAKADQVTYAYKVLADQNTRTLYTTTGAEPSASNNIIGHTLYVHLSKMSPTVVQEFAWDVDAASTTPDLVSMIIDLRGNIGGSTDTARGLMGLFIGNNQYAFDLFHQGTYEVQRTIFPHFTELDRYKEYAVLTDGQTQSTAEVLSETLRHFNIAHIIGSTTRGWGTVENTYPLETNIDPSVKYALILVNNITLRGDDQPIEGRGITPDVDISQANWKDQLPQFFNSSDLIKAAETSLAKPPTQ